MSYGNWKHILTVFIFHNSIFNGISINNTTWRDPLSYSAATFDHLFFFFFFLRFGACVSSSSFFSFSFHTRWLLLLPSLHAVSGFLFFFLFLFFFFFFHWVRSSILPSSSFPSSFTRFGFLKKSCIEWQVWGPQTV